METLSQVTVDPPVTVTRALLVVWQNPFTRRFVSVAQLTHLADGRFAFRYLPAAKQSEEFYPLLEYPDLDQTYLSDELPVFFANRVMSPNRSNYRQYLRWLGLSDADPGSIPVEVLARTGGGRATDTFHIVDQPVRGEAAFMSRFFVSGIRHVEPSATGPAVVRAGDRLELRRQPDNVTNPRAVIIDVENGQQLGWVPDWLCGEVSELLDAGWSLELTAEQVNDDAPARTRVLCKLEGASR